MIDDPVTMVSTSLESMANFDCASSNLFLTIHPDLFLNATDGFKVREGVRGECAAALALQTDCEFIHQFSSRCPVPDATPIDYVPKVVSLSNDNRVLAGIRFRNLDVTKAFIQILATDTARIDVQLIRDLQRALPGAFSPFRPKRLLIRLTPGQAEVIGTSVSVEVDKYEVAGRIKDMLKASVSTGINRVGLNAPRNLDFYPRYAALYDELAVARPSIAAVVPREDQESLAASLQQQLLFEIEIDGQWAGIFALERDPYYGMDGFYIKEEILSPEFRGQGLGVGLQRRLAYRLQACQESWIHGTIHGLNVPSLKTALRAGRSVFHHRVFVSL